VSQHTTYDVSEITCSPLQVKCHRNQNDMWLVFTGKRKQLISEKLFGVVC
jgi:hypothetical protein